MGRMVIISVVAVLILVLLVVGGFVVYDLGYHNRFQDVTPTPQNRFTKQMIIYFNSSSFKKAEKLKNFMYKSQ